MTYSEYTYVFKQILLLPSAQALASLGQVPNCGLPIIYGLRAWKEIYGVRLEISTLAICEYICIFLKEKR